MNKVTKYYIISEKQQQTNKTVGHLNLNTYVIILFINSLTINFFNDFILEVL